MCLSFYLETDVATVSLGFGLLQLLSCHVFLRRFVPTPFWYCAWIPPATSEVHIPMHFLHMYLQVYAYIPVFTAFWRLVEKSGFPNSVLVPKKYIGGSGVLTSSMLSFPYTLDSHSQICGPRFPRELPMFARGLRDISWVSYWGLS